VPFDIHAFLGPRSLRIMMFILQFVWFWVLIKGVK